MRLFVCLFVFFFFFGIQLEEVSMSFWGIVVTPQKRKYKYGYIKESSYVVLRGSIFVSRVAIVLTSKRFLVFLKLSIKANNNE